MRLRKMLVAAALTAAVIVSAAPQAAAAPVVFGTLSSSTGTLLVDLAELDIMSLDVPTAYLPGDPFLESAAITYNVVEPVVVNGVPARFKMGVQQGTNFGGGLGLYGPGSWSIGLDDGAASAPWVTASFANAFLALSGDFLTGTFGNIGGTTFSGPGFDLTGLSNLGSFVFFLSNPQIFTDALGNPIALGYEIAVGALVAEDVAVPQIPEPTSLLLLGSGMFAIGLSIRRRLAKQ